MTPDYSASPTIEARHAQAFPVLAPEEVDRLVRFGTLQQYADGSRLYETGKPNPGMFVVLSGNVRVTRRDGHGHDLLIVEYSPGMFSGELGQLSGRRSFVDATAIGDVRTALLPPERLRAALIAEAALGERIMRALILRRVGLIETGAGGPLLVGSASSPDVTRLSSFLARNGIPHLVLDPASDSEARVIFDRYAPSPAELPLALCPDGSILRVDCRSDLRPDGGPMGRWPWQ